MTVTLKEKLLDFCKEYAQKRIEGIQNAILQIKEDLKSETKSSAGDKHETGRAMLQLELEKLGKQLFEAEKIANTLKKVNLNAVSSIGLGALIQTNSGNYFIAISAGLYDDQNQKVYCISPKTPIGQLLLGKKAGETVLFRNKKIIIEAIS